MAKKGMKGEMDGSPGAATGDVGSRSKGENPEDTYWQEGRSGLGLTRKAVAGSPEGAADLKRKGTSKNNI